MQEKKDYTFYKIGEWAYRNIYSIYQPVYFFWKGRKDKVKIDFLKEKIKPGMTVVDIGANIGFYSQIFSKMVGEKGKVHAFEPEQRNYKHLLANTKNLKNVVNNNAAVSDKSGKIKLYECDVNIDHQTYDNGEGRSFTEIDCFSLDDYFKNGERVDMVKTDTQGYDYFVLKGMQELVKRSEHFILLTEFWPFGLNKSGVSPGNFVSQLKEMGFTLTFMDAGAEKIYEQKINDWSYYTDIIAIK